MTVQFWTEDGLHTITELTHCHASNEVDAANWRALLAEFADEAAFNAAFRAFQAEQRAAPVTPQRDDPMPLDRSAREGLTLPERHAAGGD